jgi:hypothetical protein
MICPPLREQWANRHRAFSFPSRRKIAHCRQAILRPRAVDRTLLGGWIELSCPTTVETRLARRLDKASCPQLLMNEEPKCLMMNEAIKAEIRIGG